MGRIMPGSVLAVRRGGPPGSRGYVAGVAAGAELLELPELPEPLEPLEPPMFGQFTVEPE
jgi:hypothetical protein